MSTVNSHESHMSSPSISSGPRHGSGLDSLYQVRLLSALRSGDPARIHPFLTDITKDRRTSSESDLDLGAAALHLAIRCASCDTIGLLLSHRSISPNAVYPHGTGTTALHLAASLSRTDVVNLLLDQEGIDDSLRDHQGKTCLEVARGKDTSRAIRDSRSFLTASYRSLLRSYIMSPHSAPPPDALVKLLESPRIRLVDLSYLDDASGRALLHEAAQRKDLRLVEKAIRAGADVFVRDRKGRPVYESAPKDDRVRVFLRQFTNQDNSLIKEPSTEPPELRGYLNKYTNVAKGYNTRWFVLHQGFYHFADYRHQDDENLACRGSIALRNAVLTVPTGTSGLRFEVHSTPSRGHSSVQKWYLKANHPVEASRWITALQKSMEIAKREGEQQDRRSGESDAPSLKPSLSVSGSSHRSRHKDRSTSGVISNTSSTAGDAESGGEAIDRKGPSNVFDDLEPEGEDVSDTDSTQQIPPHTNSFELQGNALLAQVDLAAQLLSGLPTQVPGTPRAAELNKAIDDTFHSVTGMLSEYVNMVKDREEWYKAKLERERERQNIWEESLQAVVREGDMLERELRSKFRHRGRAPSAAQEGTLRKRPSIMASPPAGETVLTPTAGSPTVAQPDSPGIEGAPSPADTISQRTGLRASIALAGLPASGTRPFSLIMAGAPAAGSAVVDEEAGDTDEEDEFFDAIEANTLPNLVITQSLIQPGSAQFYISREVYAGYVKLRDRLAISSDDRPPMSLWAVLKNSIGKDLTKISFPVFFNEPTSMLQRMAEDMEFSECLDAAYAEEDPQRRIAFVAAFAMSNYSSTIGRIAKPFNPMLSETFEYVRHDKQYRYVSEQVSHHPPISACWAESPMWRYYGEVDAQNKFMGKSFEIRPTGIAHAELLLPEEHAPDYPKARGPHVKGRVVEHYSWKKVTTNVSGFILGSPTIDHYGDMVITNHRTGDQCVLTFKPRGWRGKDAYEISGYVADVNGNVTYELAGRWNSQLVARQVGTGVGQLHPDVAMGGSSSPSSNEYILLWRNSVKPGAPFNLTPFAITLNDCPEDTLKPYVCPTDCRMRPDQRAFELGRYEHANDLKTKQEEFQRQTRKAREEGRLPPHKARWFSATTEPDTGERVWMPAMVDEQPEYWVEREKVWKQKQSAASASWKDVGPIFIDDEP
ncbi:Oxysterol-binding protein-domain-containing protein [Daedaleopsis nitida]|nr:Oxysterol-binding protein-domain-containing protein [Daedaleopsis nitida]